MWNMLCLHICLWHSCLCVCPSCPTGKQACHWDKSWELTSWVMKYRKRYWDWCGLLKPKTLLHCHTPPIWPHLLILHRQSHYEPSSQIYEPMVGSFSFKLPKSTIDSAVSQFSLTAGQERPLHIPLFTCQDWEYRNIVARLAFTWV